MKKILVVFFTLFCVVQPTLANDVIYSDNTPSCITFLKGFQSCNCFHSKAILTCGNINFGNIKAVSNRPVYSALIDFCINRQNVKLAETKYPFLTTQMKIIDKLTDKKNRYGIILSSKHNIDCLKDAKIKNLKVFKVRKSFEIPYIVDKAVKSSDIILLYPEKFLDNSLIVEFIIKKIVLAGKSYVAYSKKYLELGAKAVFLVNFLKEGKRFADIISKGNVNGKIIEPKFFKVEVNKSVE